MNATVVIPTYWAGDDACANAPGIYDHSTTTQRRPIPNSTAAWPRLSRCATFRALSFWWSVPFLPRPMCRCACTRLSTRIPTLRVTVVTNTQASRIADRVAQIAPKGSGECVSLRGYGAIRNMGLACAAVLGHDAVVFLDDDETVIDADFMKRATYALGQQTRQGLPILVKSGYFLRSRRIAAGSHGQGGHLPSLVDQAHRVQSLDEKGALGHSHLAFQLRVRRPYGTARPRLYACGL